MPLILVYTKKELLYGKLTCFPKGKILRKHLFFGGVAQINLHGTNLLQRTQYVSWSRFILTLYLSNTGVASFNNRAEELAHTPAWVLIPRQEIKYQKSVNKISLPVRPSLQGIAFKDTLHAFILVCVRFLCDWY